MKNLMKAQIYQLKKNKIMYLLFAALMVMGIANVSGEMSYMDWQISGGEYIASGGYFVLSMHAMLLVTILTAEICGADFMDKTGNYELMTGYRRRDIFFSRVSLSILLCIPIALFMIGAVVAVSVLLGGWGTELVAGDVFLRILLLIFPMFRLICEFVFISYVLKNQYIVMGFGVFLWMAGAAISFPAEALAWSSIGAMQKLLSFSKVSKFYLGSDVEINIYESAISAGDALQVVVISVLAGVFFLWLGYQFFKKDDMN